MTDYDSSIPKDYFGLLLNYGFECFVKKIGNNELYSDKTNERMLTELRKSHVIIIIADYLSPDMLVEIGFAVALRKRIILFSNINNNLPSIIRSNVICSERNFGESEIDIIKTELNKIIDRSENNEARSIFDLYTRRTNIVEQISGKDFEDLVYEMFKNAHIKVEKDIYSSLAYDMTVQINNEPVVIECKKLAMNSKVSLNYVQQLYGIMSALKIEYGCLVSNVEYTNSAIEFSKMLNDRIKLMTINELYSSLFEYSNNRNNKFNEWPNKR